MSIRDHPDVRVLVFHAGDEVSANVLFSAEQAGFFPAVHETRLV